MNNIIEYDSKIKKATIKCFERYLTFNIKDNEKQLIEEAIKNYDKYPIDKLSRWLGFILN